MLSAGRSQYPTVQPVSPRCPIWHPSSLASALCWGLTASRSCSAAASPTATSRSRSAARTTSCACPATTPSCSASTARPSGRPPARRRRSASARRRRRCSTSRPAWSPASSPASPWSRPTCATPEAIGVVATALRQMHDSGTQLPVTFSSFEVIEEYARLGRSRGRLGAGRLSRGAAPGAPGEDGAHRPRARAGALPQRPAGGELHPLQRRLLHRRLGVRRHGRPLLRPRQLRRQQRARRGWRGGAARRLLPRAADRPAPRAR